MTRFPQFVTENHVRGPFAGSGARAEAGVQRRSRERPHPLLLDRRRSADESYPSQGVRQAAVRRRLLV